MGCTTSHDAFAAAASRVRRRATGHTSSSSASRRDPAAVCRERAALIRAAADRRFALAAAHAAYFRSLAAVGGALRRFAAAALLPADPDDHASPVLTLPPSPAKPVATTSTLPPSPSGSSSTVSPLSHSLSDDSDDEDLHALDHSRRFRSRNAPPPQPARQQHRHYMRNSAAAPNVVYEDPYAEYAEAQTGYGYPYGPYGEVVPGDRRPRGGPPPTPPPPEPSASAWDFFNPFRPYEQFLEEYSSGNGGGVSSNFPANSPNYAEVRRMEGIPELEDEAELEAKAAAASNPSTSAVVHENGKGKRPVPTTNAGSKGESSSERKGSSDPKSGPSEVKMQSKGLSAGPKGEPSQSQVKQSKESTGAANGKVPMPSNASSKSKKGTGSNDAASLKGTGSGDIDGNSSTSTGKKNKKGVAFDKDVSTVHAYGGEGGSHSKPAHPAMTVSSDSFSPLHSGDRDVMEAMDEIKGRFEEAADYGDDVSKLLEVGKLPHRATPKVLRCGFLFHRVLLSLPPQTTKELKIAEQHFCFIGQSWKKS